MIMTEPNKAFDIFWGNVWHYGHERRNLFS